jgi:HTH-type transcriptional regulator/antitoxin HigA
MKTHDPVVKRRPLPRTFGALVRAYPLRALRDEVDHDNAWEMIDRLTSTPRRTAGQQEYLDTLSILFSAYEQEHYAIETSDLPPLEIVQDLLDHNDMTASDLGRLLGDRSLGAKILRGERQLSKEHIVRLCDRFKVSADLFLNRVAFTRRVA